jgi:hypothetical protein
MVCKVMEILIAEDEKDISFGYKEALEERGHSVVITSNGVSRGLGIGLGKNFPYVQKGFEFGIFAQALVNTQFAIGLGEGLGYVFSYLDNELQDRVVQKSNENNQVARGLGIGLGCVFEFLNDDKGELQKRIFREMDNNKVLAESIGACVCYNFSRLKDHTLLQRILTKGEDRLEFAGMCLEENYDNNIKDLNNQIQGQLIDICDLNRNIYQLYKCIAYIVQYHHCNEPLNDMNFCAYLAIVPHCRTSNIPDYGSISGT